MWLSKGLPGHTVRNIPRYDMGHNIVKEVSTTALYFSNKLCSNFNASPIVFFVTMIHGRQSRQGKREVTKYFFRKRFVQILVIVVETVVILLRYLKTSFLGP